MPNKRGPKGKNILEAKQRLMKQIRANLTTLDARMKNSGKDTDIVGALNHILLLLNDLETISRDMVLYHYSDGIHTSRTGSFEARKYKDYLNRLRKRLTQASLVKPTPIKSLNWHGGLCLEAMEIPLQASAQLQSDLRSIWVSYFQKEIPNVQTTYMLNSLATF